MNRAGSYGWSPEQLARINARRAAKGRDILVDKKFENPDYAKRYIGQSESYAARAQKSISPSAKDEEKDNPSMRTEAKDRTKKFREKFKPKGSMAAEYGYKSSFPTPISKGLREAAGKPLIRKSWDEMNV